MLVSTLAAAALLWAFAALILRGLLAHARFECFCFGPSDDAPLSPTALARTTMLAILATALLVASAGSPPAGTWPTFVHQAVVAGAAVASAALLGAVSKLRRWNDDPFGVDQSKWSAKLPPAP